MVRVLNRSSQIAAFSTCLLLAFGATATSVLAQTKQTRLRFNRDIRPILSDKCFVCHGPDQNERQAELRLDIRDEAIAARDDMPAIKPGDVEQSAVVYRIFSEDENERMPPADSGRALSDDERKLLRQWIAEGAEYEQHWAYVAPERAAPPKVDGGEHPIDAFIIARLKAKGWNLAAEADRRTLIRRLSFDLTGLPPTVEEVEAFINDKSADAYERLVDRLLGSKHYGERMAVFWLDAVRYADTNGIHGDNHREHWLFRDYVINAFNDNKPFDVFTREQIAGDLLESPTREQQIASGYNRLNMTTREGGAQAKEYRAKYAADRVRNASTVWLGSTMGCSECHDHKFDPFSQKEFYQFAAFFADLQETAVGVQQPKRLPTDEQQKQAAELDAAIAGLKKTLNTATPELEKAQAIWETEFRDRGPKWQPLTAAELNSQGGATLEALKDKSIRASGAKPDKDAYTVHVETAEPITAFRLEALPDDKAPAKGPGRAGNGNFVVTEFEVFAGERKIEFGTITGTHSQKGWPAKAAADGNADSGWAVLPHVGKVNSLVFETKADAPAGKLKIVIHQNHGRGAHTLAHFRVSATSAARPVRAGDDGVPAGLAEILRLPADKRSAEQANKLAAHYRSIAPALAGARKQLADAEKKRKSVADAAPALLVAQTMAKPRMIRVLPRGNWLDDSGEIVAPSTPSFLNEMPKFDGRATRTELAEWVVDPNNPLTARVFVNRLWSIAFGEGIVRSLDDFGSQGEWPTHPQLLDWLAIEFRKSGWDTKKTLKTILMSRAYRQSSLTNETKLAEDPYNRMLGRQNRFRFAAEMVRDNALATSGLLVHRLGGKSAKPYQPLGYWSHLNFPKRVYKPDQGEDQYRRGLYTYWCRTFLHPSMLAFDAPSREECTVKRARSNTPLAALVLLNDPTYVEAARVTAERLLMETPTDATDAERLSRLFRKSLQRKPTAAEEKILLGVVAKHREQYLKSREEADKVRKNGFQASSSEVDPVELAAWTSGVRVVFNLHEFINRN